MKKPLVLSTNLIAVLLLIVLTFSLFFGFTQINFALSVPVSTPVSSLSSGNLVQYEWSQLNGDSSFTRFSAGPAPEAADILWKANISGIQPYISAFNGMVFVATNTTVYALDRNLGSVIWSTVVPTLGPWPSVYKIDDTHLVAGNSCLDTNTGRILWSTSDFSATPAPLFTYNTYSPEEKMFYTKVNSYIQAWNFSDPSKPPLLAWSIYVSGGGSDGSGVQYGDGKVFSGSFEAYQVALDAKTGAILWETNTKAAMLFSGTYADGKFFRGGAHDNTFYAFDAGTGKIMWTFNPGTADGYWCSGTAAAYGMVYSLNKDGHLYALDQNTGKVVWQYMGTGPLMFPGTPTVADGKIYATTGQEEAFTGQRSVSEFACLDAYTGHVIWKLPIEAFAPRESVAIAYGTLYMIPGDVTTAVDSISGAEYSALDQIWAFRTEDWPMYRHDSAHTGVGQFGPVDLTLRWSFATSGAVVSSPTIVSERAYFGSQDKSIYCVNANDGCFIWKFITLNSIKSSPAIINDKAYTGADDGYVYCLDAYNGSLLWKTFAGGSAPASFNAAVILRSSPTVVKDIVYVGALDNKTYAIDAINGGVIWTRQTNGCITSSPAVVDDAVYITSQEPASGVLYKLNCTNGYIIWKQMLPYESTLGGGTDMHASPTVADGMVFASSNCVTHYGINATTGDIIWTYRDEAARGFIVSSSIYVDGTLFLVNHFSIVALDAKTGNVTWSTVIGDELYISPTYADGKLYVVTDQRHLYILNATDGKKLSFYSFGSNSWSSPSIYEGRVYVGSNDWAVYCFTQYPPLSSKVTLDLPSSNTPLNELVTGYGQLIPGVSNASLTVAVVRPDSAINEIQTTTTENGRFTFTFIPNMVGNWTITAQWLSDKSYYTTSTSEPQSITVTNPLPSTPVPSFSSTAIPSEQQKIMGIPIIYIGIMVFVIVILIAAIAIYLRTKNSKNASQISAIV